METRETEAKGKRGPAGVVRRLRFLCVLGRPTYLLMVCRRPVAVGVKGRKEGREQGYIVVFRAGVELRKYTSRQAKTRV